MHFEKHCVLKDNFGRIRHTSFEICRILVFVSTNAKFIRENDEIKLSLGVFFINFSKSIYNSSKQ